MQIAKVSTKGQITVPKLVREIMGITEGDTLAFLFEENTITVRKVDVSLLQNIHGAHYGQLHQ